MFETDNEDLASSVGLGGGLMVIEKPASLTTEDLQWLDDDVKVLYEDILVCDPDFVFVFSSSAIYTQSDVCAYEFWLFLAD